MESRNTAKMKQLDIAQPRVQSYVTSYEIRDGRGENVQGFSLNIIPPLFHRVFIYHRLLRCKTALTSITSSVFKFGASSLIRHVAGYRVR